MPITIKRPESDSTEKSALPKVIQSQIISSTKLDTTDYTKTTEPANFQKTKNKVDVINLKYPEGTTQRVKTFYSSTGHNMTSGFLMSFELTVELLAKGLISFSKGGYRINPNLEK